VHASATTNSWLLCFITLLAAILRFHAITAKSFEFYRSQKHPSPVWPAALVSANGADWAYRDSLFAYLGESLQDAGPGGNRAWLILDLDRGADGKPNMESTLLRAAFGKGRHLVDEEHISQITILLFARDASNPI
jgi:hypothetical protein